LEKVWKKKSTLTTSCSELRTKPTQRDREVVGQKRRKGKKVGGSQKVSIKKKKIRRILFPIRKNDVGIKTGKEGFWTTVLIKF